MAPITAAHVSTNTAAGKRQNPPGIALRHDRFGKLWQNGTLESFNGTFRDECLSAEWFRSPGKARVAISLWRTHTR